LGGPPIYVYPIVALAEHVPFIAFIGNVTGIDCVYVILLLYVYIVAAAYPVILVGADVLKAAEESISVYCELNVNVFTLHPIHVRFDALVITL
jgi:hypothetical protein